MRNRRRIGALLLALAWLVAIPAAGLGQNQQLGSVSGRITIHGEPAAGVHVRMPWADAGMNHPRPLTAVTDADGAYRIEGVTPGKYFLAPYTPGYVGPFYGFGFAGKHVTIAPGEQVTGIDVDLTPGGAISGRVVDENGRPVIAQPVSLLRIGENGSPEMVQIPFFRSMRTDDRGIYRIFGLPAGTYLVSVGGRSSGSVQLRQTFHPSATDASEATRVTILSGGEALNVDIATAGRERTFSASGVVLDAGTDRPIPNLLVIAAPDGGMFVGQNNSATTNSRGEFRFTGLPAGRYRAVLQNAGALMGLTDGSYAEPVPFTLDDDVSGIELRARRGGTISGRIAVEGAGDPTALERVQSLAVTASAPGGGEEDRFGQRRGFAQVGPDGTFSISGLPPGSYTLEPVSMMSQQEFTKQRVVRDGVPVETVALGQGETVTGVLLVVGYGTGTVRGQIALTGGTVPVGTRLVLQLRKPGESHPTKATGIDERGRFLVEKVQPGTYELHLAIGNGPWEFDARPLKPLGETVIVPAGGTVELSTTVDLQDTELGEGGNDD